MCSAIMHIRNAKWIAIVVFTLFTSTTHAQAHQDLSAVISSGNSSLSEAVYGLHATAYFSEGNLNVIGEGQAISLDFNASDFGSINFADVMLNDVNTAIIRFENTSQAATALDASAFSAMENLSNVVLLFTYNIEGNDAANLSLGTLPSGVSSYYSISIAE